MDQPSKPVDQVISEWLEIAVDRFQFSIREKKIGVTGNLFKSFVSNIFRNSGGNIARVEIEFLFYGRYIDMGVGRGIPIGGKGKFDTSGPADRLFKKSRKPKKWYSKTKAFEIGQLTRILADQYGIQTARAVESALDNQKIIIDF